MVPETPASTLKFYFENYLDNRTHFQLTSNSTCNSIALWFCDFNWHLLVIDFEECNYILRIEHCRLQTLKSRPLFPRQTLVTLFHFDSYSARLLFLATLKYLNISLWLCLLFPWPWQVPVVIITLQTFYIILMSMMVQLSDILFAMKWKNWSKLEWCIFSDITWI